MLVSVLDSKIKQFRIQHAAATQLAAVQAKKIAEGTVAAPPPKLNLKERQSLLATLQVCVCVCVWRQSSLASTVVVCVMKG